MQGAIQNFLQQNPRNKIIITQEDIEGFEYLNMGLELAVRLKDTKPSRHFSLEAKSKIDTLVKNFTVEHPLFGRSIAIKNPGILLEPELNFNFPAFLENNTRDSLLILTWNGEIEGKTLYFLTK